MPLLAFCAGLLLVQPCAATPGQWTLTDSLDPARSHHTATLLQNGMVLMAGGFDDSNGNKFASAELYDPASGTWTPTGSLNIARAFHTATLLPNGMVLVAGGVGSTLLGGAELYDPASGTWSMTGSMVAARGGHSAILLPNGKVLVACGGLRAAELYDPATGNWSLTGSTSVNHVEAATPVPLNLLPNGLVLLAGGVGDHSVPITTAELYDPATGTWSMTGYLQTARYDHTATVLPNGMVLVAGGHDSDFVPIASAELYDPASGIWSFTGSLVDEHARHTATLLTNGLVLVASGLNFAGFTKDAELYDPASGTWSVTGSLNTARAEFTATLLPNGIVLAAAGYGGGITVLSSAELYDPGIVTATQVDGQGSIDAPAGPANFNFHAALSGDRGGGVLSYRDPAAGLMGKGKVRSLTINGTSADFSGIAKLGDGSKVRFNVSVTDSSEDGSSDTFSITLSNGYSAGGTLTSGNITIQ